jgi:hypothetical protein
MTDKKGKNDSPAKVIPSSTVAKIIPDITPIEPPQAESAVDPSAVELVRADELRPFIQKKKLPRYTLIASTTLTDDATPACLAGRITEISRAGCYAEILNTRPVGTLLLVHIFRDSETFKTKGKIVYVREPIGVGIAFIDPPTEQLEVLDSWLTDLLLSAASS